MSAERDKYRRRKIAAQVARAELQRQVLALRLRGDTYEDIGRVLKISWQSAYRAFRKSLEAIPALEAEAARRESLARLDAIRAEAWRHLDDDPAAMLTILIRCEERVARLLGLDPRTPSVEVNVLGPDRGGIPIALARQMLADIQNSGEPIDIEQIDIDTEEQLSQDDSNTDEQPLPAVVSVEEARAALKALESEGGTDGDSAED